MDRPRTSPVHIRRSSVSAITTTTRKYPINYYNNSQLKYFFNNGVPYQVEEFNDQASFQEQMQSLFALYAQDRWTLKRLSLAGGLRFEHLSDHFGDQQIGPNYLLPVAAVFPAQDGPLHQKDLLPRFGASYDMFGNGKTAVKFFLGRYLTTFNTVDEWINYSPAGLGHFIQQRDAQLDRREQRLSS